MVSHDHGFGGAVGVFAGGVSKRLARKDVRWYMWLPALTGLICVPFMVANYMVAGAYTALIVSIVPGILFNVYLYPAMTHGLVGCACVRWPQRFCSSF